jgi:ketosteroid isomerase-like protein
MKTRATFLFLAFALVGALLVPATAAKENSEAQIQALEEQFMKAFNAKDVDAVMAVYAPGDELFVFDVSVPREYVGWDAYKKDWQSFFGSLQGPVKAEISDLKITTGDGDLAFSHSIQHVTGTSNGKPMDLTVRVTDGYRKIHGKWLIVQEHVSVPVDFTTGKPDLMSKP